MINRSGTSIPRIAPIRLSNPAGWKPATSAIMLLSKTTAVFMHPTNQRINHQPALLLSTTPWRESSLLAEVFSRDYGRVLLLARSARKRQSELRGVLVPFVPINLSWYGTQEMKTLHRAEWLGGWPQPQGEALFGGLYVNELVQQLTAREDPHPKLFDALCIVLRQLAITTDHPSILRRFEWMLLQETGFAPDPARDQHGNPIIATQRYALQAEQAPRPVSVPPLAGGNEVMVHGHTLLALAGGDWPHAEALREARQLTRMLLDFRLPYGSRSRHILQQLRQWQQALASGESHDRPAIDAVPPAAADD